MAVQYQSYMDALFDAQELMKHGATSIETVDSKVLNLAMNDFVWAQSTFRPQRKVFKESIWSNSELRCH